MDVRRSISTKADSFTESVIREMNRLAVNAGAVSLAQGFPDFPCPPELKTRGRRGRRRGPQPVRHHLGQQAAAGRDRGDDPAPLPGLGTIDPETQVTVTCGATEAMIAAMLGLLDPGDEVVIFEPFYENYGPDAILSGAVPRYVTLHEPDWSIDPDELRAAFGPKTRAIVVNSPHNPTGKVFSRAELELIAELCQEHDVVALTDDIYEHIVFEGEHIPLATIPGMADRTVSIHSMSKTYSVTGWRDRLGHRVAGAVGRRPTRPRLPDGRGGGAAAGRGRRRAAVPGRLLPGARRRVPRAPRCACCRLSAPPASASWTRPGPTT